MTNRPQPLTNPEPDGVHFLVEFFGCEHDSLNSMTFWKKILVRSAKAAGMKVLNQHFYQFSPEGITGYLLLSSSHISIHTWPEHGYVACDVFSCGGDEETQAAVDHIIAELPHQRVQLKRIKRGYRFDGDVDQHTDNFTTTRVDAPPLRIPIQRLLHKARSAFQEIIICDTAEFGRCLLLDGLIQCSESDHELYDKTMLSQMNQADRRLLILGGGYIAATALCLNPSLAEITVVDLDKEVVNACRSHFNQTVFDDVRVKLVVQDALQLMEQQDHAAYDGIICDLTDFPVGYNDAELQDFYGRVFELSAETLKGNSWISIYAGSVGVCLSGRGLAVDVLTDLLEQNFRDAERQEGFIPSFGESSNFLYGSRKV